MPSTTASKTTTPSYGIVHRSNLQDNSEESTSKSTNKLTTKAVKHRIIRQVSSLTSSPTRSKRSGWLTSIFGVATSDDLTELFQSEIKLHDREDLLEQGMQKMTNLTNSLVINFRNITQDINTITKNERKLYKSVEELIDIEDSTLTKIKGLASSLDRLTALSAEYNALTSQIMLLIHGLEKAHLWSN
jgi:DNA repair ATPase RecN